MARAGGRCGCPHPPGASRRPSRRGYLRPDGRHTGSLGVHAEGTGCEGMGWAGLLWTQGPCPARGCACHGFPEAEWHQSGLPRLHPRQQGGAAGAGGQAAGGVGEDPLGVPVPPMSPAPPPQMMQTSIPGVFAAGDAVTFPLAWRNNRRVNIPHWQMAHAQGTASPVAAASPRARPSAAACGPCSWGLPLRALQWPIRPASHRRWSRLAATSFPRPLQHPLGAQFRAPAHCPCPSLSFPAVLKHRVPQKSSPTHAVTGGGEVSRTQSSSPLHPLWATRQTVKLAAACRPLGGGRLGLETHVPLPVGGHCTHLVQAPQLPVQPVSFSGRMARRAAPSSVLVTLAPSEPEAPLLVPASVQA